MQYTNLGNSGLYVSRLCLGAMTFGGTITTAEEATAVVDEAMDAGINFIDTSNVYNNGLSEELLGTAIKGRREELIVSTKVYFSTEPEEHRALGASRTGILREVDSSLKRLGTDYIDLYLVHSFDFFAPLEESMATLNDLVRAGKVRYIGVSNFAGWQIAKAQAVADKLGLEKLCATQSHYSLVCRDLEHEIVPAAEDAGLGIVVWSPLSGGFLTGKYTRDGKGEGRRAMISIPPVDSRYCFDVLDVVDDIAARQGTTPANIAMAWLLHRPSVTSVILGVSRPEQLSANLGAIEVQLSDSDLDALNEVSKPAVLYPHWTRFSIRGEYSMERIGQFYEDMANNKRNSVLGAGEAV